MFCKVQESLNMVGMDYLASSDYIILQTDTITREICGDRAWEMREFSVLVFWFFLLTTVERNWVTSLGYANFSLGRIKRALVHRCAFPSPQHSVGLFSWCCWCSAHLYSLSLSPGHMWTVCKPVAACIHLRVFSGYGSRLDCAQVSARQVDRTELVNKLGLELVDKYSGFLVSSRWF